MTMAGTWVRWQHLGDLGILAGSGNGRAPGAGVVVVCRGSDVVAVGVGDVVVQRSWGRRHLVHGRLLSPVIHGRQQLGQLLFGNGSGVWETPKRLRSPKGDGGGLGDTSATVAERAGGDCDGD